MQNRLLTLQQLAEYMQVSEKTIRNSIKRGLPNMKIGNRYRFDLADVMKWLEVNNGKG